jgi:hypothetical protein
MSSNNNNKKESIKLTWAPKSPVSREESMGGEEKPKVQAPEKKKKASRITATFSIDENTRDIIQRAAYWESGLSQGEIIDLLVQKLQEEKKYEPIPDKKPKLL